MSDSKRQNDKTPLSLEEAQVVALGVLDELDSFCKTHNIPYFLIGGSLIGAVRNQDLVPWDDDIDVAMKREDYERFCREYTDSENFKLFTYRRAENYRQGMAKLSDQRTIFDEHNIRSTNYGVFVDVFPLDEVKSYSSLKVKLIRLRFYLYVYAYLLSKEITRGNALKTIVRVVCSATLGRVPYQKTAAKLEKAMASEQGDYYINYWGAWGSREHASKAAFASTTPVTLKDKQYPAPCGYEEWLTNIYGDYMSEPSDPPTYHGCAYWADGETSR